jgi:hypothetical protein
MRRSLWFALGLVGGAVAGYAWWSREQAVHQRALYSPRPMRRLAALGWLSGRPTAETVMMLREYVGWESHAVLRRRARRLLQRFENALA